MDTLFSVFVIGTLVVIAWRGVWGIMDLTLYPGQKSKSAWGSLVSKNFKLFQNENYKGNKNNSTPRFR